MHPSHRPVPSEPSWGWEVDFKASCGNRLSGGWGGRCGRGYRVLCVGMQEIDAAVLERLEDFLPQLAPGLAQKLDCRRADFGDHFADLELLAGVDLDHRGPSAHQQVPDGHGQFAGHGGDGQLDGSFAGQESLAPAGQGRLGGTEDGLGGLDQQAAQVLAAVAADAAAPSLVAAVVEGGVEADVFDQLFGMRETVDVAQDRTQGKGYEVAHPAESGQGQELGVGEDLLGDETAPMLALLLSVTELQEQALDHLPLARRPISGFAKLAFGHVRVGQRGVGLQPHTVVTEIGEQAVADLGGASDALAMSVKEVAAVLGFGIGDPNDLGGAGQVGLGDAHGADFVVVSVGLLEAAHLAAFQHQGLAPHGGQAADNLEAVARGLQEDRVLRLGMLAGPTGELAQGDFVEEFLDEGGRGGGALDDRRREGVRVGIQPDHALYRESVLIHCIDAVCADGRKRVRRVHALRYTGRSPCRCVAPVLIREDGE